MADANARSSYENGRFALRGHKVARAVNPSGTSFELDVRWSKTNQTTLGQQKLAP